MSSKTPFLAMFPCCEPFAELCGGLSSASIFSVKLSREQLHMELEANFVCPPSPDEHALLEDCIAAEFGLLRVSLRLWAPVKKSAAQPKKRASAAKGAALYGKAFKAAPAPVSDLRQDSGEVVVEGDVLDVTSKLLQKGSGAVLSFDLTDYTGTVRVSKYIHGANERAVIDKIKKGMTVAVRGHMEFDRYEGDIRLTPSAICLAEKALREDTSEAGKRVELHLHTRYSALDALTDPEEAVAQAARWGHPAVAITDHGVAQAYPEAWKAGKKYGVKVIFGLEGYFANDVDERAAFRGGRGLPLNTEICAFDLETTGLDAQNERITEIGAVILKNGRILNRFQTFVNPGRPIPAEITELTGIRDRDVYDAPGEAEAVAQFLAFAKDRPLAAHNAGFDVSFVEAACARQNILFDPSYLDTLVLAQFLLPELPRHRLDRVASRLGLPEFRHHRAVDDAAVVARILEKFLPTLKSLGAETLDDLNAVCLRAWGEDSAPRHTYHINLLVQNKTGLKNLYTLISKAHLEHFHKNPVIPKSLLTAHREGLLVGSACAAGELFDALTHGRSQSELRRIASFYDFLEIMPVCNNAFLLNNGTAKDEEQLREFNRRVFALAKKLGKPCAATGDAHFLNPEHEIYRKILLASKKFSDADKDLPIYFKTTGEMLDEFAYLGDDAAREVVIETPNAIAARCEEIELLPKKLFPPTIEHSAEDLEFLVRNRLRELYGAHPPERVQERVETELRDIIGGHYDVVYMAAQKLVANSLEAGYLVGSRGSVGSSFAAYLAGITEVNALPPHYRCAHCHHTDFGAGRDYGCGADMPDKLCPVCGAELKKDGFDIPFEIFMGVGGDKVPDIDLNFSGEYQARAHKYTEELFGADHVFRAGTIGTLAEKTAYGYVKKYLEERGLVVTKAEETRLSQGLVGIKRTTGQHPGGLVIIPREMEVTDFCPVQHPADDKDSDIVTTHFEYHCMESNLLKLDELGHDDPTMIRMLEDLTGVEARDIRLDDPETMRIFKSPAPLGLPEDDPVIGRTGTIGVPEFGTPFTRGMLVDTQPTEFATLVRLSGFSHGEAVWAGNAKELILGGKVSVKDTISCREDLMLYLISKGMEAKAAFQIMETVRKKGKPLSDEQVESMRDLGVPGWYIDSCQKIQYLFPKAHAVAYVMMAFRIAWYKVHEPLAFYAAYFYRRSQKDSFDASVMIRGIEPVRKKLAEIARLQNPTAKEEDLQTTLEAVYEFYSRGFVFENLDLYKSDASRFLPTEKGLRPPFLTVSGLGEAAAQDLIRVREGGRQFISLEELLLACPKLNQANAEQLKALGALGDLPETSQMSFF
ncbi:MAG: PolC-type DNA polymerase III [Firmicutes bacterium]|nr:PolC-type DNA polymerase III [Bacillota bacterium]